MLGAGFRMVCVLVVGVSMALVLRDAERRLRDKRTVFAVVRTTTVLFGLLGAVGLYWRELPHEVLACAAFGAMCPALVLGVASRVTGPAEGRSTAHLVINAGSIALATLAFWWLLPKLPGIVRLYWTGVHDSGYASPSTLWWALALLAFNTACIELVLRMLSDEPRHVAMLRFAETLFTGFNLGVVVVWIGVAADALPGIRVFDQSLVVAGFVVGAAVLVALTYAPRMLARTQISSSLEPPT